MKVIFREEIYKRDDPELRGKAEIIIAKRRNGPRRKIRSCLLTEFHSLRQLASGG